MKNEVQLIARLRSRDQTALVELIDRDRDSLIYQARRWQFNEHDAEEVVMTVFLNAWNRISQFRGDSSLFTWMTRMTRNLCINHFHHERRRGSAGKTSFDQPIGFAPGSPTLGETLPDECSVTGQVELLEDETAFQAASRRLPRHFQQILSMAVDQRCSYRQIASELNLPMGTVKSRLNRSREELRKQLLLTDSS